MKITDVKVLNLVGRQIPPEGRIEEWFTRPTDIYPQYPRAEWFTGTGPVTTRTSR